MSLFGKTCGTMIYGPRADYHCCEHGCEDCRVGCFNPAAHRNPFFGKYFGDVDGHWWRCCTYSYAEYLCAKCYDQMVSNLRETEDFYRREDAKYKEDPEFTKVLETL